jgi:RsiW-degrading membrane proteinase PrsW (M82 family)
MASGRDPVQAAADGTRDLHEVATWAPASRSDRLLAWLVARPLAVLVPGGLALLGMQVVLADWRFSTDPVVLGLAAGSAVPALLLAWYVDRYDATPGLPRRALLATLVLGIALAGYAGAATTLLSIPVRFGLPTLGASQFVTTTVLFFAVVAPVEEFVKLAAVRAQVARGVAFRTVVDGAVYGAMAGLGFAILENAFYVAGGLGGPVATPGTTAGFRALAGPGHVLFTAFAGYYLGLARFNPDYGRALVTKGLLLAAGLHGAYNLGMTTLPGAIEDLVGFSAFAAALSVAVAFHGAVALALFRRLSHYNAAYRETVDSDVRPGFSGAADRGHRSEMTEFDP